MSCSGAWLGLNEATRPTESEQSLLGLTLRENAGPVSWETSGISIEGSNELTMGVMCDLQNCRTFQVFTNQ